MLVYTWHTQSSNTHPKHFELKKALNFSFNLLPVCTCASTYLDANNSKFPCKFQAGKLLVVWNPIVSPSCGWNLPSCRKSASFTCNLHVIRLKQILWRFNFCVGTRFCGNIPVHIFPHHAQFLDFCSSVILICTSEVKFLDFCVLVWYLLHLVKLKFWTLCAILIRTLKVFEKGRVWSFRLTD